MEGNGAKQYRVGQLPKAKEQVRMLGQRAIARGILPDLTSALRTIHSRLRSRASDWGEPLFHTHQSGGTVRKACLGGLAVVYIAYEAQKVALIWSIEPLASHPLAEE